MIRHTPRREPRVLALDTNAVSLAYVVADLFEVRSSGQEPVTTARSLRLRLRRLVRRERPTVIVALCADDLGRHLGHTRHAVALVEPPSNPLPFPTVAHVYSEAPLFAPNRRLARLTRFAVTALARSSFPSRRYAKTPRHRTSLRPSRRP